MTFSFVFPGQGSQSVGMLGELAGQAAEVGETFAEASEVLGFDLWALVQSGPAETLGETVNTHKTGMRGFYLVIYSFVSGLAVWLYLAA